MFVFLNGQVLKEEDAKVSISDLSYQFGYGLFETIRCEQGIPLFIESHYKRLTHSAREIGMPFPVDLEEIKNWIKQILDANKLKNARLKIIISKRLVSIGGDKEARLVPIYLDKPSGFGKAGSRSNVTAEPAENKKEKFNVLILASPVETLPSSYSLLVKKLARDINSISYRHKTTSRADSYFSYKQATHEGFNDVLFCNEKNELIECSRANIFLVMEDKLITPLLESGILSGVTRANIIEIAKSEGIQIEEKNVHSLYLNKAKDVFITSAVVGIMPVSKVKLEDKEYSFSRSSLTTRLKNSYDLEVSQYIKNNSKVTIEC